MGIKILIAEACLIAGENIAREAAIGQTVEVPKDDALSLTRMGRAYYVEKGDDPTKGRLTADADVKDLVKRKAAAVAEDLKQREVVAQAQSPAGMAALMAQAFLAAQATAAQPAKP